MGFKFNTMKNKKGKSLFEGVIYKYTNKINGKVYIGQTINENRRKQEHLLARENSYFHNAIKKYGWNSFEYKVLFRIRCISKQDLINTLNQKEEIAIKYFNSTDNNLGYNIRSGGNNSPIPKEMKKKLSEMRKGEKNPMYGIHQVVSEETRRKISKSNKGRNAGEKHPFFEKKLGPLSEERKRILSEKNTKSPVIQLSLEGEFIKEWPSAKKASKDLNINDGRIGSVCMGKSITAGGYRWLYKSDYESGNYTFKSTDPYNIKSIVQLDMECNFIKEFDSIARASRDTNINRTTINRVLAHKVGGKTAGGFIWLYKKEYDELINNNKLKEVLLAPKRPIIQTDKNGNFIKEWNSMEEAAENLNVSAAIIRLSILNNKGVRKLNWNKFFEKKNYYGTIAA